MEFIGLALSIVVAMLNSYMAKTSRWTAQDMEWSPFWSRVFYRFWVVVAIFSWGFALGWALECVL